MSPIRLICLDFDLSITSAHLHNECAELVNHLQQYGSEEEKDAFAQNRIEYLWDHLSEEKKIPAGDALKWKQFFTELAQKAPVAIVSRNNYQGLIKKFLEHVIKIDEPLLSNIFIEQGNTKAPNKIGHIKNALEHFYPGGNNESFLGVIFFDDTWDELPPIEQLNGVTVHLPTATQQNIDAAVAELPKAIAQINKKN